MQKIYIKFVFKIFFFLANVLPLGSVSGSVSVWMMMRIQNPDLHYNLCGSTLLAKLNETFFCMFRLLDLEGVDLPTSAPEVPPPPPHFRFSQTN